MHISITFSFIINHDQNRSRIFARDYKKCAVYEFNFKNTDVTYACSTLSCETQADTNRSLSMVLAIFVHLHRYPVHEMLLNMIIIRVEYRKPLVATDRSAAIRVN